MLVRRLFFVDSSHACSSTVDGRASESILDDLWFNPRAQQTLFTIKFDPLCTGTAPVTRHQVDNVVMGHEKTFLMFASLHHSIDIPSANTVIIITALACTRNNVILR